MPGNYKCRLVSFTGGYALVFPDGRSKPVQDLRSFLLTFDANEHYSSSSSIFVDSADFEPLAIVDKDSNLILSNPSLMKEILNPPVKYIPLTEYAEKHGKQRSIVCRHCREGRIPGAIQQEQRWLIPEGTPYPELDKRGPKKA